MFLLRPISASYYVLFLRLHRSIFWKQMAGMRRRPIIIKVVFFCSAASSVVRWIHSTTTSFASEESAFMALNEYFLLRADDAKALSSSRSPFTCPLFGQLLLRPFCFYRMFFLSFLIRCDAIQSFCSSCFLSRESNFDFLNGENWEKLSSTLCV